MCHNHVHLYRVLCVRVTILLLVYICSTLSGSSDVGASATFASKLRIFWYSLLDHTHVDAFSGQLYWRTFDISYFIFTFDLCCVDHDSNHLWSWVVSQMSARIHVCMPACCVFVGLKIVVSLRNFVFVCCCMLSCSRGRLVYSIHDYIRESCLCVMEKPCAVCTLWTVVSSCVHPID